jgi:hypothetical protein
MTPLDVFGGVKYLLFFAPFLFPLAPWFAKTPRDRAGYERTPGSRIQLGCCRTCPGLRRRSRIADLLLHSFERGNTFLLTA